MNPSEFSKCECRHCHGHIEFPSDAAGQNYPCPHCGQLVELAEPLKKRSLLPLAITIGLLILISGITVWFVLPDKNETHAAAKNDSSSATNFSAAKNHSPEFVTNDFSVSTAKLTKTTNSSLVYVTGKARNLSAQKRFGVKIEFSVFDSNAIAAGHASDYIATLEPAAVWNFKALVVDARATDVKFDSIAETK
jgi:hypothetical protein